MGERTEERVKAIKEIFEEYAREYVALLNKYAAERARLWNEIKDDDLLEEELYRLEEEGNREIGELQKICEERLRALGDLEVEWDAGSDGWSYFNAPGYNYYVCIEYHNVIDKNVKKVHLIGIYYLELNRPDGTEYKLEEVATDTHELVDEEETPFTTVLIKKLSEYPIRPLWAHQIDDLISELAAAERRGELEEKLEEVKERAERAAWVYEYKNFLSALYKTAEEFNIQL
jgi:hypothetical protein